MDLVSLQENDFDIDGSVEKVKGSTDRIGGIVTFLGSVRSVSKGMKVEKLDYKAYRDMAEDELSRIREEALGTEGVHEVLIHHRLGELSLGENTVLIVVGSEHREEAFNTAKWVIDEVKERVPVWKKEFTENDDHWVENNKFRR